jgi:hypothetical protein
MGEDEGALAVRALHRLAERDRRTRRRRRPGRAPRPQPVVDAETGKSADVHQLEIWRIENDLIVEHWGGLHEYERFEDQLR